MTLIPTEAKNFSRDTSNMALVNTNKRAYDLYKQRKQNQQEKDDRVKSLEAQLAEMRELLTSFIEGKKEDD